MNEDRLVASVCDHEGYRKHPYLDHLGNWTVGWGTLIHDLPIRHYLLHETLGALLDHLSDSDNHGLWLMDSIEVAISDAERWLSSNTFRELSDTRQEVIVEMAYQLGHGGLSSFVKFRAAVVDGHWSVAHAEMLDSLWARQTPTRAQTLADRFLADEFSTA